MQTHSAPICYASVEKGDTILLRGRVTAKDNHKITLGYYDRYHSADKSLTIDCDQWLYFHGSRLSAPVHCGYYITPKQCYLLASVLKNAITNNLHPEDTSTLQVLLNRLTDTAYTPHQAQSRRPRPHHRLLRPLRLQRPRNSRPGRPILSHLLHPHRRPSHRP